MLLLLLLPLASVVSHASSRLTWSPPLPLPCTCLRSAPSYVHLYILVYARSLPPRATVRAVLLLSYRSTRKPSRCLLFPVHDH